MKKKTEKTALESAEKERDSSRRNLLEIQSVDRNRWKKSMQVWNVEEKLDTIILPTEKIVHDLTREDWFRGGKVCELRKRVKISALPIQASRELFVSYHAPVSSNLINLWQTINQILYLPQYISRAIFPVRISFLLIFGTKCFYHASVAP